jgi:hypothetical protein
MQREREREGGRERAGGERGGTERAARAGQHGHTGTGGPLISKWAAAKPPRGQHAPQPAQTPRRTAPRRPQGFGLPPLLPRWPLAPTAHGPHLALVTCNPPPPPPPLHHPTPRHAHTPDPNPNGHRRAPRSSQQLTCMDVGMGMGMRHENENELEQARAHNGHRPCH